VKTAELEGAALDYWVARAEGYRFWLEQRGDYRLAVKQKPGAREPYKSHQQWETHKQRYIEITEFKQLEVGFFGEGIPKFSTDWASGGPLIQREHIWLSDESDEEDSGDAPVWIASMPPHVDFNNGRDLVQEGPTPLIAAMRAFVASKFGDEVEDIKDPT